MKTALQGHLQDKNGTFLPDFFTVAPFQRFEDKRGLNGEAFALFSATKT